MVTTTYANAFLVVALLCAAGALLALLLRSGPPQPAPAEKPVAAPTPAVAPEPEPVAAVVAREASREPVAAGRRRPRHHHETPEETEARRYRESTHAAAGVHL